MTVICLPTLKKSATIFDNTHLNTYAQYLHYDLKIEDNNNNFVFVNDQIIELFFEPNILYPQQSIFKFPP